MHRLILSSLLTTTLAAPMAPDWVATFGAGAELDGPAHAISYVAGGSGSSLVVAGSFTNAGGAPAGRVARWDGASWSPLGAGFDDEAYALATFDGGAGRDLYAGGQFLFADGAPAARIARFDGTTWQPVGGGIHRTVGHWPGYVAAMLEYDDGSGPSLFVAGWFDRAGDTRAYNIARWDGAEWHPVGGGTSNGVFTLAVHDDGTGPALYAGGFFTEAGGTPAWGIARWDGATWSSVGNQFVGGVNALVSFDGELYAGGTLTSLASAPEEFNLITRFDGVDWRPVGGVVTGPYGAKVNSMTVFDDGNGPALFAGGLFWSAGGERANGIARWDGADWSSLGLGVNDRVDALTVGRDAGGSPALFVGGAFTSSPAGDAFLGCYR